MLQGIQIFFKRIFHQSSIDSIFDIEDIYLITKGFARTKLIHANACKDTKSSFSRGIPSRINLWRFS